MTNLPPQFAVQPVLKPAMAARRRKSGSTAFNVTGPSGFDQRIDQAGKSPVVPAVVPADAAKEQVKRIGREPSGRLQISQLELQSYPGRFRAPLRQFLVFLADVMPDDPCSTLRQQNTEMRGTSAQIEYGLALKPAHKLRHPVHHRRGVAAGDELVVFLGVLAGDGIPAIFDPVKHAVNKIDRHK